MRRAASHTLDRRIARLLVGRVRRRWPISRLVPSRWLEPLLVAPAQRVRYGLVAVMGTQVVITSALLAAF